jgi:hypothetical protein
MKTIKSITKSATGAVYNSGKSAAKSVGKVASSTANALSKQSSKGYTSIKTAVGNTNPKKLNTQGIVLIVLGVLVLVGLGVGIYFLTKKECDMYCEAVKSIQPHFNSREVDGPNKLRSIMNTLWSNTNYLTNQERLSITNGNYNTDFSNSNNFNLYKTQIKNLLTKACSTTINIEDGSAGSKKFATTYKKVLNTDDKLLKLILFHVVATLWTEQGTIIDGLVFKHENYKGNKKSDQFDMSDVTTTGAVILLKEWLNNHVHEELKKGDEDATQFFSNVFGTNTVCLK